MFQKIVEFFLRILLPIKVMEKIYENEIKPLQEGIKKRNKELINLRKEEAKLINDFYKKKRKKIDVRKLNKRLNKT